MEWLQAFKIKLFLIRLICLNNEKAYLVPQPSQKILSMIDILISLVLALIMFTIGSSLKPGQFW